MANASLALLTLLRRKRVGNARLDKCTHKRGMATRDDLIFHQAGDTTYVSKINIIFDIFKGYNLIGKNWQIHGQSPNPPSLQFIMIYVYSYHTYGAFSGQKITFKISSKQNKSIELYNRSNISIEFFNRNV